MSFEDVVDEHIAARIVHWMGGPYYALNLRLASRRCAEIVRAPQKISDIGEIVKTAVQIGDSATCLRALTLVEDDRRAEIMHGAAYHGAIYDRRDILAYVFDASRPGTAAFSELSAGRSVTTAMWLREHMFSYESVAMEPAARTGNLNLCEFIRDCIVLCDYWGETEERIRVLPFSLMMAGAARANRADLFELGWKWSGEYTHSRPSLNELMHCWAYSGNLDMCRRTRELAISSDQTIDADRMLHSAAQGGSVEGCKLAREWGATKFGMMLSFAASSGMIEVCKLAREWHDTTGPSDEFIFLNAMLNATGPSNLEVFHFVYEWFRAKQKRDLSLGEIRGIIGSASANGNAKLCEFLYREMRQYESRNPTDETRSRIAEILDEAMNSAVLNGTVEVCEMLRSWGAVNYESYLKYADIEVRAYECYDREIRNLVKKWIAERDAAR